MAGAKRGAFIVFEGIDRVGKSSQCSMLVDLLSANSYPSKVFRFPDRTTEIGRRIDAYLQNKANINDRIIHLLFSLNRHECSKKITETLKAGTTIVCDRYCFSGAAYTMAKSDSKTVFDYEWCITPDIGLPQPDLILFLDMSVVQAMERADFGGERYETREFQEKIRANFHYIKDRSEGRGGPEWKEIDATKSKVEVAALIAEYTLPLLEKITTSEVQMLSLRSIGLPSYEVGGGNVTARAAARQSRENLRLESTKTEDATKTADYCRDGPMSKNTLDLGGKWGGQEQLEY